LGGWGKAETDSAGRFELRIDPTAPLGEASTADGVVNFEILALGADGGAAFSFSRRLDKAAPASTWIAVDPSGVTPGMAPTAELQAPLTLRANPIPLSLSSAPEATSKTCTTTVLAQYSNQLTKVGEVYTGPSAKAEVKYQTGAKSSLGVGYSPTGTYGSWTVSGTTSWTTDSTTTFGWYYQNASRILRTTYGYEKTITQCYDSGYSWHSYALRPWRFEGGASSISATRPSYSFSNCRWYDINTGLKRDDGTGYSWSSGVSVAGLIGIDLTAKTDYSVKTSTEYVFVYANGYLCGTNGPPGTATRLVARGP
jgi:hypothetical protein